MDTTLAVFIDGPRAGTCDALPMQVPKLIRLPSYSGAKFLAFTHQGEAPDDSVLEPDFVEYHCVFLSLDRRVGLFSLHEHAADAVKSLVLPEE